MAILTYRLHVDSILPYENPRWESRILSSEAPLAPNHR
jgi:hypothetical protein